MNLSSETSIYLYYEWNYLHNNIVIMEKIRYASTQGIDQNWFNLELTFWNFVCVIRSPWQNLQFIFKLVRYHKIIFIIGQTGTRGRIQYSGSRTRSKVGPPPPTHENYMPLVRMTTRLGGLWTSYILFCRDSFTYVAKTEVLRYSHLD